MGILRRTRREFPGYRPCHLAVTVAGEPAFIIDLLALVEGRVTGQRDSRVAFSRESDYPVFPGNREGTRMQSLAAFKTTPSVGVWIGDPGAFDPVQDTG